MWIFKFYIPCSIAPRNDVSHCLKLLSISAKYLLNTYKTILYWNVRCFAFCLLSCLLVFHVTKSAFPKGFHFFSSFKTSLKRTRHSNFDIFKGALRDFFRHNIFFLKFSDHYSLRHFAHFLCRNFGLQCFRTMWAIQRLVRN